VAYFTDADEPAPTRAEVMKALNSASASDLKKLRAAFDCPTKKQIVKAVKKASRKTSPSIDRQLDDLERRMADVRDRIGKSGQLNKSASGSVVAVHENLHDRIDNVLRHDGLTKAQIKLSRAPSKAPPAPTETDLLVTKAAEFRRISEATSDPDARAGYDALAGELEAQVVTAKLNKAKKTTKAAPTPTITKRS
jgi:hypothetical protein